jgi:hypothetical protein
VTPPPQASPGRLCRALVHTGVGLFGLRRLADPDPLFGELEQAFPLGEALARADLTWDEAGVALAQLAPRLPGALGGLLRDHRLQLHEWFLLALAGETENSHPLNLALTLLQAPDGGARPTLHLCCALCGELFGAGVTPLDVAHHPLVGDGLLTLTGDAPLPLRSLATTPALWALLLGDSAPWPGCSLLEPGPLGLVPAAVEDRLPRLAGLIAGGAARIAAFRGSPPAGRAAAARLAAALGLRALAVPTELWEREPALRAACRYGGWLPVLAPELGPGERYRPASGARPGPVALALGREGAVDAAGLVEVDVPPLPLAERRALWSGLLGNPPEHLAERALLDGPAIAAVAERARLEADWLGEALGPGHLTHARLQLGADRLRQLAQPVPRPVPAEALVLPPALERRFDDLVRRCERRERLRDGLGAALSDPKDTGVRALFVGESGTGKTLAAGRLATRLGAPLYRLDLAAVLNKYVGETEKNLGLTLDAAAANDALLLLDEADALFGRRTEGGETGERFANMLTNFLLSRIESHPGIVLLTSNSRSRIDPAFTRRLDAILEFPLPGVEERRRLWQAHLGERGPGAEACALLAAYCDLPGGYVRNAVLAAAARDGGEASEPIPLALLVDALREEYRKLGRAVPPQLDQLGR